MRTLRVVSGPAAGESLRIEQEVVIGREGADLTITDPQISRRHTSVKPTDDGVEVTDLGSLNGTFVNGERLNGPIVLTSSGKIRIGDSEIEIELAADGVTQMAPSPEAPGARGSVRRVEEPEPGATEAPAASAAPAPRAEPPPRRPPPPRVTPVDAAPARGRAARLLPLLALLVAAAVAAGLYFALRDDDEATSQPLIASVRTADLVQGKRAITFAGAVNQSPGGVGTLMARLSLKKDLKAGGAAVDLTGTMVFRFDDGRIDATVTGTAKQRKDKSTDLVLTGKVIRGTREFEGAKGSFKWKSGQEAATVPTVGISSIEGTITY